MGFFDKAKKKFQDTAGSFGEETIRVVDYDELEKDEPEETTSVPTNIPTDNYSDSAFSVEDGGSDFFEKQEEVHQELIKSYGDRPVPTVLEGRIQDVLELLSIPATFEIDASVLLPEDFKGVSFDIQIPQGYEMGEVNAFVSRAKNSVEELVKLLKLRNKHIAELATTVDRLQVDANNLKVQAEVANGINIMPTDDGEDLEKENMELGLKVRRLEDEIRSLKQEGASSGGSSGMSDRDQRMYNALSDRLSVVQRELEEFKEENADLKSQLAVYIENESLIDANADTADSAIAYEDYAGNSINDDFIEEPLEYSDNSSPYDTNSHNQDEYNSHGYIASEITYDDSSDEELPDFGELSFDGIDSSSNVGIPEISSDSAFAADDEGDLNEFLEENSQYYQGHEYDSGSSSFADDDDEDELDAIFNSGRSI